MLGMEQLLSELNGEELNEQGLPPGFRFHPTDEELITFYLASKVFKGSFSGVQIAEVDLNRCEPWELPDVAKMGEREWYFYSVRDRKYPTGLRTNRATGAGYWKATGKDREVYSNGAASSSALLGMKKTLVFYKGRAPRGQKTKWVMHEYRLDGDFSYRHASKEEWVICRIIHKNGEKKNPIYPISSCQSYMLETSANTLPPLLETNPTPTLIECQSHSHSLSQTAAIQQMQMQMQAFQNPFDQIHNNNNPYNSENDFKTLVSSLVSQSNFLSSNNDPFFQSSPLYSHKPPVSIINDTVTSNGINAIANSNNNMFINTPSPSALLPSVLFKSLLSNQDFPLLKQESDTFKQTKVESGYSHFELPNSNSDLMDMKNQPNLVNYQRQQEQENPLFYEMECNGRGVDETSTSIAFNRAGYQTMLDPLGHGESWPLDA